MLKLTPLRLSNVPPPMALKEIKVDQSIIDVSLMDCGSSGLRIAILHQAGLSLFEWRLSFRPVHSPSLIASTRNLASSSQVSDYCRNPLFRQVSFTSSSELVLLCSTTKGSLVYFTALNGTILALTQPLHLPSIREILSPLLIKSMPICLWPCDHSIEQKSFDIGESTDKLCILSPDKVLEGIESILVSTQESTWTSGADKLPKESRHPFAVFSLSKSGSLYRNRVCLANDCTSFIITTKHLIFTTSQNLLKLVHLGSAKGTHSTRRFSSCANDEMIDLQVPKDVPEADERCRRVESGARIVTVCPSASALVLQMPRGNLETIFPRALVLAEVRRCIEGHMYGRAFSSCRTHRIDMNIIYDYCPDEFLQHIGLFLAELHRVEHIDLFLSSLR